MMICTKCKKEMKCVATGKVAVWRGHHCYSGDEFECGSCGATVLKCDRQSYHSKIQLSEKTHDYVIEMNTNDIE